MAPITWRLSARVDAPPDRVFAWMTDFCEDDHDRPAFRRGAGAPEGKPAASSRRILSREDRVVHLEDRWGRNVFRSRVEADPERREVRITAEHGYSAVWRAVPDADGTRVEAGGELAPRGVFRLLLPIIARGFRRQMEQDFRGHIEDLREEMKA